MLTAKRMITLLLCVVLGVPATFGQTSQRNDLTKQSVSQEVQILIQQQQVRFTAQKAMQEMQLQIFSQSGELVYDSGVMTGAEINWPLQTANGESLKSGLYAYTLTLKEPGAETARVRRGHFIVDRAAERDGRTDRLWITSQGENGVGTELTVARDNDTTIAGVGVANDRGNTSERDTTGRKTTDRTTNESPATKGEQQKSAAEATIAGTPGQLARFTGPGDLGNSGITASDSGNVSIMATGSGLPSPGLRVQNDGSNAIGIWSVTNSADANLVVTNGTGDLFRGFNGTGNMVFKVANDGAVIAQSTRPGLGGPALLAQNNHATGIGIWSINKSADANLVVTNNGTGPLIRAFNGGGDPVFAVANDGSVTAQSNGSGLGRPAIRAQNTHPTGIGIWSITTSADANLVVTNAGTGDLFRGFNGAGKLVFKVANDGGVIAQSNRPGLGGPAIRAQNSHSTGIGIWSITNSADANLVVTNNGAGPLIRAFNGGGNPVFAVQNNGSTIVRDLQITGGADFAENFEINTEAVKSSETMTAKVEAGMVVSIDPAQPGRLALSTQAYDRRVAGIISGAGGVKPGMIMSQEGTLADGKHPVALSGRVYCWVDATAGAIEPGDLLTTSGTSGHAMKVSDPAKAQGAIIGKAMTGLKEGKGLVLVLVTLQ